MILRSIDHDYLMIILCIVSLIQVNYLNRHFLQNSLTVPFTVGDAKEVRGLIPDNGKMENCQPG